MTEVLETLGPAGYGAMWLLLERIAETWDGKREPELQLSLKSWKKTCGLSAKKLRDLLKILENHGIIFPIEHENKLTLNAPIIIKLKDEWTSRVSKNSAVPPEPLPSDSRIQIEQQPEIYKEQNKTHPPPANLRLSLVPVLKRHGISPSSERGRKIVRYIEEKQPKNPGGYLEAILQENTSFDPQMSDTICESGSGDGSGGPLAVTDALSKMGILRKR